MRSDVTREGELKSAAKFQKAAIVAAKLLVTGICFWYLSWQIDLAQFFSSIALLEPGWTAAATLALTLQIPLVAVRSREILHVLAPDRTLTAVSIIAITAIGAFFTQLLPSLMGEGIRAWLLVRRGYDWRSSVSSVIIDRAVGVAVLLALAFVILLLPSSLSALGGYGDLVLMTYGALLAAGAAVLLVLPRLIAPLERVAYLRWPAMLAMSARRVVLGPKSPTILGLACVIHALTITAIWLLGRAQGLLLPVPDAAVLFVVVIGVALVPVSVNGWGLRELAVVAILGRYGIAPEKALAFSVCFGLLMATAALPGALVWVFYSLGPVKRSVRERECAA